jgi:hypothetical protein
MVFACGHRHTVVLITKDAVVFETRGDAIVSQMIDLGMSRDYLDDYLTGIGYWGDAHRRLRNKYVLSPSAYVASRRQTETLTSLCKRTFQAVETLSVELSRLSRKSSLSRQEAQFLSMARTGIKGLFGPDEVRGAVPPLIKIDLVQDVNGHYGIAEVDAYNPRGFGYLAFLNESMPSSVPRLGFGIDRIASIMRGCEETNNVSWTIIVSEKERYYRPAFEMLQKSLARLGVYTQLVDEENMAEVVFGNPNAHIFLLPESLDRNVGGREYLLHRYRNEALVVLYPPAAYLGSKAFLPYIATQPGMDEFVPASSLVSRYADPSVVCNGSPSVLKGVMSSGMKQIVFSDIEPELFRMTLESAREAKRPTWIMQKQVDQKPVPVVVFDEDGEREVREYYLRITAYACASGLVGADVTGRTNRLVHGAPDCIQLPVIGC